MKDLKEERKRILGTEKSGSREFKTAIPERGKVKEEEIHHTIQNIQFIFNGSEFAAATGRLYQFKS